LTRGSFVFTHLAFVVASGAISPTRADALLVAFGDDDLSGRGGP
jgi:ribulose 1,5-bisphosphate carboxylase large subunit-like protein